MTPSDAMLPLVGLPLALLVSAGGFLWYALVAYPLALRRARRDGLVPVGTDGIGEPLFVEYREGEWRRATFAEWRRARRFAAERLSLWPRPAAFG
jgi:hypothetical protein